MKSKAKIAAYMMAMLVSAANTSKVYAEAPEVVDQEIFGEDTLEEKQYVKALEDIDIYDNVNRDNVIGNIKAGQTLPYICLWDEGYYEIRYNDGIGYVECNKCDIIFKYVFENMIVLVNDVTMVKDDNTKVDVEQYSVGKLLKGNIGSWAMIEVDNQVGYVATKDIQILTDTYVLVDKSEQTLQLFQDDDLLLESPTITGRNGKSTDSGIFNVYEKKKDYLMKGFDEDTKKWYSAFSKYVVKFNKEYKEYIHDASWRSANEFANAVNIYKSNGSHGCVNVPLETAKATFDMCEEGDIVIVRP